MRYWIIIHPRRGYLVSAEREPELMFRKAKFSRRDFAHDAAIKFYAIQDARRMLDEIGTPECRIDVGNIGEHKVLFS